MIPSRGAVNGGHPSSNGTQQPNHDSSHSKPPADSTTHANGTSSSSSSSKSLAHVPCKFFKQGGCTAGKACVFSHDLTVPGTTKPICQWYAKGNCKFGHKCALAHILPGQPMSFDRKNKRAAQAALREQNGNGAGGGATTSTTNAVATAGGNLEHHQPPSIPSNQTTSPRLGLGDGSPNLVQGGGGGGGGGGSGLARSLKNSLDLGRPTPSSPSTSISSPPNPPPTNGWAHPPPSVTSSYPSLPPQQTSSNSSSNGRVLPLPQATATFVVPPSSGLSQTLHILSTTSSTTSTIPLPLSVSRPLETSHTSTSPTNTNGNGGTIFGTSPFSASRSLFMPPSTSTTTNHDESLPTPTSPPFFAHSSPSLPTPSMISHLPSSLSHSHSHSNSQKNQFSPSSWTETSNLSSRSYNEDDLLRRFGGGGAGGNSSSVGLINQNSSEEGEEEEAEDSYDQALLPSSLSELLTPEELRRRRSKGVGVVGSGSGREVGGSWDPWGSSRSVPAEMMMLSRPPPSSSSSNRQSAWSSIPTSHNHNNNTAGTASSSSLSSTSSFQNSQPHYRSPPTILTTPPLASRSLLPPPTAPSSSSSNPNTLQRPTFSQLSASFDPSTSHPLPTTTSTSSFSRPPPLANKSLHTQMGSSLPGGLAAGLSQLHLIPAREFDTPLGGSPSGSHSHSHQYAVSPPTSSGRGGVWPGSGMGPNTLNWGTQEVIRDGRRLSNQLLGGNGMGMGTSPLSYEVRGGGGGGGFLGGASAGGMNGFGAGHGGHVGQGAGHAEWEEDIQFDLDIET